MIGGGRGCVPEGEGVKEADVQERLQTLPERLQEAVFAISAQTGQAATALDVVRRGDDIDLHDVAMADALEASRQNLSQASPPLGMLCTQYPCSSACLLAIFITQYVYADKVISDQKCFPCLIEKDQNLLIWAVRC